MPRQLLMTPQAIRRRELYKARKQHKQLQQIREANRQHTQNVNIKRTRRAMKQQLTKRLKKRRKEIKRQEKGIIKVVKRGQNKLTMYRARQTGITVKGQAIRFHKIEVNPSLPAELIQPMLREITDTIERNQLIRLTAYFPLLGIWRSTKPFKGGDEPIIPNLMENTYNSGVEYNEDDTLISEITLFIHSEPRRQRQGGDSIHNDCLYECFEQAFD